MKQTAVEWLETQLKNILGNMFIDFTLQDDIEQAKQIEKEQNFEFWQGGIKSTEEGGKSFDQYYNE